MSVCCSLFEKDLILCSNAQTQDEVFSEIGNILIEKGLVKESFIEAIKSREKEYPTGLDLSPVEKGLSNVAIPHTEPEYCRSQSIVFVKLNNEVTFKNMISPEVDVSVTYLFFIINNKKQNQTNVLSNLMAFLTNKENVKNLDTLNSAESIYNFLTNKF
ncbi:PTS sugar transporter subunit IIA [Virgibacillus dokdonensis]|uniref:PTS sugar transporter subunit IIA n=1 Tax=Virgibacillus dokdonensis TaxID=302167 RepID=A0ABU7VJL2_9BACI